jgi:hypothetical protein
MEGEVGNVLVKIKKKNGKQNCGSYFRSIMMQ